MKPALLLAVGWTLAQSCLAGEETVPTVQVSGHYQNAVGSSDAASQGSITGELIANRPALRTGELLEFVPGMIVTQHSGDGKANQYFLRGFNLDHGTDFATYVDGMPVNMRTHAHGQGYSDLNFVIPELVQRIDYKKGPYFAEEGDFASAGAAHLRLADRLPQGVVSLSAGQNGYWRTVLADTVQAGAGRLLYGVEANRNDGPWDLPERVRRYSAMARYSAGTGDQGYNVTAMAYHNRWNATDQIPQRAVDAGLIGRYGNLDNTDGGSSARYSLSSAWRRRSDTGLTELDAYLLHSRLDLFSNFTYALERPEQGDQFSQSERRNTAGLNAAHSWQSGLAGLAMRNKLGLQVRFDRLAPVRLYQTEARLRSATVREDTVRESSAALYGENLTQWTPWLRSVAGVRYDAYRFQVDSSVAGNSGKARDHIASPKLSLVFGPWDKTEYFVNYGKGFHSNDARGATQTRLADGGASAPVTPLVPTRGRELGLRTELAPGLQSSLAVWRLDIDSELVFVGDAGDTEPSRASRRRGIEWNNHYIATPWLLFDLDLATSHARYSQADAVGNDIPGALNRVLSFGATVRDAGRWSGSFNLRYFGPRPLLEDGSVRSASTTLAYARAAYRLRPDTRVTLDVFNLFDRRASDIDYYYRSRLPGEAADGADDRHFHPVEPRTVRLTLARSF
ncbi:TonB-dependent receptor plug domain-containing protein [Pseudoduganella sp. FT25W]|uniref:TonB-dependent receptor plug domain-containing protein n=1 Tax=Duganella alba TaxID=2666081 RepID=A0A6L5QR49_9BURK|nr:TonB-dependent receptor [Duganella alba]MRX11792.1 TonB-dependent receptor plug domain-containing protein [Duganella alba]MRX20285.1 TonB-dependent receptor plug domain-containing protein [Duganella alba]